MLRIKSAFIILFTCCVACLGCNDGKRESPTNRLVGVWLSDKIEQGNADTTYKVEYVLCADKNAELNLQGYKGDKFIGTIQHLGSYTYSETELTLSIGAESEQCQYVFNDDNVLKLTYADSETEELERQLSLATTPICGTWTAITKQTVGVMQPIYIKWTFIIRPDKLMTVLNSISSNEIDEFAYSQLVIAGGYDFDAGAEKITLKVAGERDLGISCYMVGNDTLNVLFEDVDISLKRVIQ